MPRPNSSRDMAYDLNWLRNGAPYAEPFQDTTSPLRALWFVMAHAARACLISLNARRVRIDARSSKSGQTDPVVMQIELSALAIA